MRRLTFILIAVLTFPAAGANGADGLLDRVAAAIRSESRERLERVDVRRVEGFDDTYVAICDTQTEWWGDFRCVEFHAGRLASVASYADESSAPDEQSILSARGFRLSGFEGAVLEVFGTTHMGNGNYYLYELRAKKLHLLLTTRAVDSHDDGRVFRGGALKPEYRDLNGDGRVDIMLSGTIDFYSEQGPGPPKERPLKSSPCRKVFLWDRVKGQFVEDVTKREGFGPDGF